MRGTALLLVVLTAGCEASPPTSPDDTPDSVSISVVRVSEASGTISPGAVVSPFANITVSGNYFLSEQDLKPIRRLVMMWACFGHDATSFRTGCGGSGGKATLGRTAFSGSPAAPGVPVDTQFIHLLLIEAPENGNELLPTKPAGSMTGTHYPISEVVGTLRGHLALEYPIQWR